MSVATNARWKRAMLFLRVLFRSLVDTGSLFALGVEQSVQSPLELLVREFAGGVPVLERFERIGLSRFFAVP